VPGTPAGGAEGAQALVERAAAEASSEAATEDDPAPVVTAVAVVEPDAPAPTPTFSAAVGLSLESFNQVWPAVLERLDEESPMLAHALREARPAELADEGLTFAWPEASALSKRQAEDPAKKELLAQAIRAVTGASLRLAHEVRPDHEVAAAGWAGAESAAEPALSDDQLVERFMAEFDAEELPPEQPGPPSQES
jgi:DNA polymerase-3 subunit gamma/tau